MRAACAHYNQRKAILLERHHWQEDYEFTPADPGKLGWDTFNEFTARICVNFLRHQATGYDYFTQCRLKGKTAKQEAYCLWWEKFAEAVRSRYPNLANEAERQLTARSIG